MMPLLLVGQEVGWRAQPRPPEQPSELEDNAAAGGVRRQKVRRRAHTPPRPNYPRDLSSGEAKDTN